MAQRKLASIQMISHVEPIPKADAIERLRIQGWSIVAKKGEYAAGDKVIYCEIDSLLPEREEFEFLRKNCFKKAISSEGGEIQRAGFLIRTIKLRGQVSQGICFPLSLLPSGTPTEVGTDVSEALGIIKYDPPIPEGMNGRVKGNFPGFIPKTDEVRIQNVPEVLEQRSGEVFEVTEKLDGTSFTAFLREGEFGLCSRNQWLDETDEGNGLIRLANRLQLAEKLRQLRAKLGCDLAIQGEAIGPGIQGNKYRLKQTDVYWFNLVDLNAYRLIERQAQAELFSAAGLKQVPPLEQITIRHTVDELIEYAIGKSVLNKETQREGVVFRPLQDTYDETIGGRLSFKAINPKFLLKYEE